VRGLACHRCCHRRGALLPHLFTLPFNPLLHKVAQVALGAPCCHRTGLRRFVFCATFLQVALTGCYPAHCPAEFGLSSRLRGPSDRYGAASP
jgi:hypothetical protein